MPAGKRLIHSDRLYLYHQRFATSGNPPSRGFALLELTGPQDGHLARPNGLSRSKSRQYGIRTGKLPILQ